MSKHKFQVVDAGYIEVNNIHDLKPIDGTIIGLATEDEMQIAAQLESKHHALTRLQESNIQFTGESFLSLLHELETYEGNASSFWQGVYKRLGIPWEWCIRIDVANGPIYIVNEDLPFYADHDIDDEYEG